MSTSIIQDSQTLLPTSNDQTLVVPTPHTDSTTTEDVIQDRPKSKGDRHKKQKSTTNQNASSDKAKSKKSATAKRSLQTQSTDETTQASSTNDATTDTSDTTEQVSSNVNDTEADRHQSRNSTQAISSNNSTDAGRPVQQDRRNDRQHGQLDSNDNHLDTDTDADTYASGSSSSATALGDRDNSDSNNNFNDMAKAISNGNIPVGAIVGGAIGGVVLLILIIVICCCCRKRNAKKTKDQSAGSTKDMADPVAVPAQPRAGVVQGVPVLAPVHVHVNNNGSAQNLHEYPQLDPNYHNFGAQSNQHYLANQQYYQQKGPSYSMNEYPQLQPNQQYQYQNRNQANPVNPVKKQYR